MGRTEHTGPATGDPVGADALGALAAWAVSEPWARADDAARAALRDAVGNLLAVTVAGATTPEQRTLLAAWDPEPGTATVIGSGRRATAETAAWLNGVAAVTVERDEGNRHAQGHPAAQTAPAVLALAERLGLSGARLWDALFVAYELATRFGRAARLDPRVHTHGVIGLPGAAAGCALLLGLDAAGVRRAIEAACALPVATGWGPVLAGSAVRDQWVGAANVAGLAAARLAASALPLAHPVPAPHLGGTLGEVEADLLVADLGGTPAVTTSYLKQYSGCAWTHGAADAARELRHRLAGTGRDADDVVAVRAEVTGLGASLGATTWHSRLGAHFSVPFVLASALVHGDVAPHRAAVPPDPRVARVAALVSTVDATESLRGPDPTARPARVTLELADGTTLTASVEHPAGDAVASPFDAAERDALLDEALAPTGLGAASVHAAVRDLGSDLPGAVRRALARLVPAGC
ncbi:MmgE/PrpD family protein [Puerhibacterium puerhi]|uniref:MmgE/PrpD family protein n=1 Tax=Puerhibacterium puerhi TaxID=2692623 RepID=UPI00135B78AC|nr:MmgE/PrpD family protein [Puerhibacterium puerhi]